MSEKDDGGPAFPLSRANFAQDGKMLSVDWLPGMTLRTWLAGQAMASLITATISRVTFPLPAGEEMYRLTASAAYDYADAMIEASKK